MPKTPTTYERAMKEQAEKTARGQREKKVAAGLKKAFPAEKPTVAPTPRTKSQLQLKITDLMASARENDRLAKQAKEATVAEKHRKAAATFRKVAAEYKSRLAKSEAE